MNTTDKQTQDLFLGKAVDIFIVTWNTSKGFKIIQKNFATFNKNEADTLLRYKCLNDQLSALLTKYTITSIEELSELINKLP